MRWFHLGLGVLLFVIFCITGKMMRIDFPDKDLISPDLRVLIRSRHIYILFNSLIWLLLGTYYRPNPRQISLAMQRAGSLLLFMSAGLLLYGWWVESYQLAHFSDISRWGIYLSLAGVGFHLVGGILNERPASDQLSR